MRKIINVPLLVEQLKRLWAVPAALVLVFFLGVLLPIFLASEQMWTSPQRLMVQLLTMNNDVLLVASVLAPLVAAFSLFSHHFNAVANTALVALPVNRRQVFFTNVLAGVLMFGVPLLLLSLALLVPVQSEAWGPGWNVVRYGTEMVRYGTEIIDGTVHSFGWSRGFLPFWSTHIWGYLTMEMVAYGFTLNTPLVVLGFFGRAMLTFGFYFALGLLAVSVTGSRLVAILIGVIVAFMPQLVLGTVWVVANAYVFGFGLSNNFFISEATYLMHPVMIGQFLSNQQWIWTPDIHIWVVYLVQLVIMAGFFGVAWVCNIRRRAERTGDTVAFTPLKNTLIMALALAGMVIGGVIFLNIIGSRVGYYFGFVVGFVVIYFIAQMIMEKTLLIWHKVRKLGIFAGVGLGLYVTMLLVTHVVMLPYITRVPAYADVRGVYIWHTWPNPVNQPENEGHTFQFITDRQIIARTLAGHEEIINNRRSLRSHLWQEMSRQVRFVITERFPVTYQLTDGTLVHRLYRLPRDFTVRSGLEDLAREEAVILSPHVALLQPERIESISLNMGWSSHFWDTQRDMEWMQEAMRSNWEWSGDNMVIRGRENILGLAEAIRMDLVETLIMQRRRSHGEMPWPDSSSPTINVDFTMHTDMFGMSNWWGHVQLNEITHTLAWLEVYIGENLDHFR